MLSAPEFVATKVARSRLDETFAALQIQIHNDLRAQHPEWVEPDGECPVCDFYESRLAQLLEGYVLTGSDESAAAVHRALQEAASVDHLPGV